MYLRDAVRVAVDLVAVGTLDGDQLDLLALSVIALACGATGGGGIPLSATSRLDVSIQDDIRVLIGLDWNGIVAQRADGDEFVWFPERGGVRF